MSDYLCPGETFSNFSIKKPFRMRAPSKRTYLCSALQESTPLLINAHQLSSTTCVHMPLSRAASVAEAAIRNFNLSWVLRKVFRALNPQNQIPNLKP